LHTYITIVTNESKNSMCIHSTDMKMMIHAFGM